MEERRVQIGVRLRDHLVNSLSRVVSKIGLKR